MTNRIRLVLAVASLIGCLTALIALSGPARGRIPPMTVSVVVNGRTLPSSAVEIEGETVYVALRPVAQVFGADIASNARTKTITITTLLRQVILRVDDPWATVNGQRVLLPSPPRLHGVRFVLPLRALAQAFDARVSYDAHTHTARIVAALHNPPPGRPTSRAFASTKTMLGTVVSVAADASPSTLLVNSAGTNYTITVPAGMTIGFRDVHGAVSGNGVLSQVRPGDTLIVTLDASGHLISMADIFATINGTIAAVADQSMVLANGRVVSADPKIITLMLDGKEATFASLRPGDKVSIRADPVSGKVREIVAIRPGGFATSATSTPAPGRQGSSGVVQIKNVRDNATSAFRAGAVLNVGADGTPGARAAFDLSDVITALPMRETRSGHYEGQFSVTVGTNLIDAPVFVRLTRAGETAVAEAPDPLNVITTPPIVKDAAPVDGARVNTARPSIFATFVTVGNKGMNPDSLQMSLNGRDVTPKTTRTGAFISYYPSSDLNAKAVEVEVKGTDIAGNALDYTWTFQVAGR